MNELGEFMNLGEDDRHCDLCHRASQCDIHHCIVYTLEQFWIKKTYGPIYWILLRNLL